MNSGLSLAIFVLLLFLSAFFAATETALFSLTRLERRRILERHALFGRIVNDLLNHPRRVLVTLLIGNNVVNTCAAAIFTLIGLRLLGPEAMGWVVALFTILLIFFCEMMPKIFAVRNNEAVALAASPFLEGISALLWPLRRMVLAVSDWILSFLLRGRKESSHLLSAQELKVLVKIGEEEGILDREERSKIQKLFELGERPVRTIMTPRTDLVGIRLADPWEKEVETLKNFHFSHFPVYQDSLDQIVGIVSTQEVILSGERDLQKFLKPVFYVPEFKRIDELLREFQKTGERFAVCVDEFGGTAGVVTLEDVLEEIFGEFYDEYARPEPSIRELGREEYLVDGKISLSHFNEFFQTSLHSKEAGTVSGFMLEKLGHVPRKNDVLELPRASFRVHEMLKQRIVKVIVKVKR